MAERLYGTAADFARLSGREKVLDLFCGIGTIALVLALDSAEVWGVELVEEAVADAIENARLNGVDNTRFFAGDVRLVMRELLERSGSPDVVVVDPPRAGLSQKVVRRIIEADAQRIVYVSCNPTTLAPNARQLVDDGGYELRAVQPVDMFADPAHRVRGPAGAARLDVLVERDLFVRVHGAEEGPAGVEGCLDLGLRQLRPHSTQVRSITGSTPVCSSRSIRAAPDDVLHRQPGGGLRLARQVDLEPLRDVRSVETISSS